MSHSTVTPDYVRKTGSVNKPFWNQVKRGRTTRPISRHGEIMFRSSRSLSFADEVKMTVSNAFGAEGVAQNGDQRRVTETRA